MAVYFSSWTCSSIDGIDGRTSRCSTASGASGGAHLVGPIRCTPHRVTGDEEWFGEVCRQGWEGLIAKRVDASYATGRKDRWLKFECEAGQELVVVGWTDPEGSRVALGALLLGYHDGDDLVYAGKVGTGFSQDVLRDLHRRLSDVERDSSPCTGPAAHQGSALGRARARRRGRLHRWTRAGQLGTPATWGSGPTRRRTTWCANDRDRRSRDLQA